MKRRWRYGILGAALVMGLGVAGYAAVPGYHRAATPAVFGLTKITPRLYTDNPDQAPQMTAMIAMAQAQSAKFFGARLSDPTYLICTTQACADTFALKPRAVALAGRAILVGPKGVNTMILTHETIHTDLHSAYQLRDIWDQRFPAWFDEGLASHLSNDTRLTNDPAPQWITKTRARRAWGRLHATHDWRDTYGAAQSMVRLIESEIGRDGLRTLVARVAAGASFDAVLAKLRPALDAPQNAGQ